MQFELLTGFCLWITWEYSDECIHKYLSIKVSNCILIMNHLFALGIAL
jgi:hypothetical protein